MSEGRIIDFKVLSIDHAGTLERVVKDLISDGWEPHGPGHCWSAPSPEEYRIHFTQPMVKRETRYTPGPDEVRRTVIWEDKTQKQIEGLQEGAHKTFMEMLAALQVNSVAYGIKKQQDGEHMYQLTRNGYMVWLSFTEDANTIRIQGVFGTKSIP